MTALNFHLAEEAVFIVTDTLVTGDDYGPKFFTTKVHVVPHWNGIICGTGSLGFILDWLKHSLGGALAVDLADLDEFATDSLRVLYAARPEEEREKTTSTIYHFGLDESDEMFKGFAYRSTNDFISEPLLYGTHTKPAFELSDREVKGFPDDFVEVCRDQRKAQDQIAKEERVFIGGHVVAYCMQKVISMEEVSVLTTIARPFAFEDLNDDYLTCIRAIQPV